MSERDDLLVAMASTIQNYRAGEINQPTPEHVDRWICQFDEAVQVDLLREVNHVFKQSYFARADFNRYFIEQIYSTDIAGESLHDFWQSAYVLNIQQEGKSQEEIRTLFGNELKNHGDFEIDSCGKDGGAFIYLDDVLFSGSRIGNDLSAWIEKDAPPKATVHILVIVTHRFGEWKCLQRLKEIAANAAKELNFYCWPEIRFENRNRYRNDSEVLWPVEIPDHPLAQAYVAEEHKFPFEPRQPGGMSKKSIFSSETGRQLLEREFLIAGLKIRGFSENPAQGLRPLGFSPFGLGFGSMIVTYRNCPNNTPLALWWGNPTEKSSNPLSKWYPLLPRKTYS